MDKLEREKAGTKLAAGKAVLFPLLWYLLIALGVGVLWILGKRSMASLLPPEAHAAFWDALERNESVIEMLLISAPAILLYLHMYCRDRSGEEGEAEKRRLPGLVFLLLSAVCAAIGLNVLLQLSPLFEWFPAYSRESARLAGGSAFLYLIYLVIVAPLTEELLFRGLVFRRLRRSFGPISSMAVSALLFGAFHANMVQFVYAFLVGFLLAAVTEQYRNLAAPFLFHAAANLSGGFSGILLQLDTPWAFLGGGILTLFAGLLFWRMLKTVQLEEPNGKKLVKREG